MFRTRQGAALDKAARDMLIMRNVDCNGGGHDFITSAKDLSDLVKSYIEEGQMKEEKTDVDDDAIPADYTKELLAQLLTTGFIKLNFECGELRATVESVLQKMPPHQHSHTYKRRLVSGLRFHGIDAGLCKSSWSKSRNIPAGDYEYVDVKVSAPNNKTSRYIVEVNLSAEFMIARPSVGYSSMLSVLPVVYIGDMEDMKKLVQLISLGIMESMKMMGLKVPPWRRTFYLQCKWFSIYKRTITDEADPFVEKVALRASRGCRIKVNNEFAPLNFKCGNDAFGVHHRSNVGYLTSEFGNDDVSRVPLYHVD